MNIHKMRCVRALVVKLVLGGALSVAACATVPKPVNCPLPGKEVETLQSPISISVKTGEKSMGGRGYLIYKRPDRFHLVILSPFGTTLFEIFTTGDRLTCLVPSKDVAYTGLVSGLPAGSPLRSWGLMRWATERPPAGVRTSGVRDCVSPDGVHQEVSYNQQGLVEGKENDAGDRVVYRDYENVSGVALPKTVELYNRHGDTVRVVFDEPEVNQPVGEEALVPSLTGMTILPLTSFQGW